MFLTQNINITSRSVNHLSTFFFEKCDPLNYIPLFNLFMPNYFKHNSLKHMLFLIGVLKRPDIC